ncbi:MAG: hypothetical protein K2O45_00755, partial [Oscillospiraceae bacterium]|nr:hypothetical protein [Oscillospiraceae bacterium]
MGKIIYIDKNMQNGAFGILFTQDIQIIYTGLEFHTEDDEALLAEISRLCGTEFFLRKQEPEISLYCVPYLEIFASDKRGGWFAMAQDGTSGPVYHIGPDLSLRLVTEYFGELLSLMVLDPDWRQKCLAGGPWPRLPEDPAGRKALAEMLHLPLPEQEQVKAPGPLPRVFVSRAAAEREFPIQDIWTILRCRKEPRFQIHPMMSPADREG